METIKNIAAVLGLILAAASVITLVSKSVRSALAAAFRKYGNTDSMETNVTQIKEMLERHIEDDEKYKEHMAEFEQHMLELSDVNVEFVKTQCRNIIKNIFYRYNSEKTLPLFEKKTLMRIRELYMDRLNGNSFAGLLLDEMEDWKVDYESGNGGLDED